MLNALTLNETRRDYTRVKSGEFLLHYHLCKLNSMHVHELILILSL